jgi:hypothetical protein
MRCLHGVGSNPTVVARLPHSTTGRLITLGVDTISARALAASVTPACTAGSSFRHMVPLRFTSFSQPSESIQWSSRGCGTPCFL